MSPPVIIPRNPREEFRIHRQQVGNSYVVSPRVFARIDSGELRAGDEGVAIRLDHLPGIIRGLSAALAGAGNG